MTGNVTTQGNRRAPRTRLFRGVRGLPGFDSEAQVPALCPSALCSLDWCVSRGISPEDVVAS
jgi:hypothetical protein